MRTNGRVWRVGISIGVALALVGSVLGLAAAPVAAQGGEVGLDVVAVDVAPAPDRFSTLTLTFDRAVDPASFTVDDVAVPGVDVVSVAQVDAVTFTVTLDGASPDANHALVIGPDVTDLAGVALDDDRDGTPGEAGDEFDALLVGADSAVGPGGTELTDRHVVVTDATLTVDGPHQLDGLDVAEGGVVTHTAFTAGGTGLDLTVRNQARVLAGGALDADKRGQGHTPGTDGTAGSHGGEGSDAQPASFSQATYGDFRDPTEPGRGGGNATYSVGTGGGVVRLSAGDRIVVDGRVSADGEDVTIQRSTSSGGSVQLDAPAVEGTGEVSADGGSSPFNSTTFAGFGGGGRIALRGVAVGDELVEKTEACGGVLTGTGAIPAGGAGTVFVEEAGVEQLVVNGCGLAGAADTPLYDPAPEVHDLTVDEVIVRDAAVASLVEPLHTTTLSVVEGSTLTHPQTRIESGHPRLRATVDGVATIDASSTIDVSHRGMPAFSVSRAPTTFPGTTIGNGYDAGGAYGGVSDRRDGNAPYGDAAFPNELGAAGWGSSPYGWSTGGGLVQLAAGELQLDGAIHADGQAGTSFSCGPSCRSYSYAGSGGGVLVHAGTLSGAGSITATGGDAGGNFPDDHGSGGRVAVQAAGWAGFDPGNISALPGGLSQATPTRAEAGTVVTSGARAVGWTEPVDLTPVDDEVIFHDTEVLGWFAPAGTTADVVLTPLAGGTPIVLGQGLEGSRLEFDTTSVPNGRYQLTVTAGAGGGVVGSHTRTVVVTNVAGVTWFDQRHISQNTTLPGGVVFFEHDVTAQGSTQLVVPAGATYKFAPGVGISMRPGGLTIEAGVVATSWADDTVVGDTNFDGDSTVPAAGDWAGFRGNGFDATEGFATIDPSAELRYDTVNSPGNLWDGYVFESDRTYFLWRRAGTVATHSSPGETITFEPGAVLKGNYNSSFDLQGRTEWLATPERPVVFTPHYDDTVGGDLNRDRGHIAPVPGDIWEFKATNTSPVRNLEVRYAGGGNIPVTLQSPSGDPLEVDGLTVRDSMAGSVNLTGAGVEVTNSVFDQVAGGVRITSSNATSSVVNSTIVGGTTAVTLSGSNALLELVNTTITDFLTTGVSAPANRVTTSYSNLWSTHPGAVHYSSTQPAGTGNLSVDPLFLNPFVGDYTLLGGSPLIDAGDGTRSPLLDADGLPRVDGPAPNTGQPNADGIHPDIGAFEHQQSGNELTIGSVSPSTASNIGPVTFTVTGSKFTPGTTATLSRQGSVLEPLQLDFVNTSRLTAQFDLTGVTPGPWDLTVDDGTDQVTSQGAITIVDGGNPGRLEVTFTVPEFGRNWIAMPAVVSWRNVGDTDLDAPLIGLTAEGAQYFRPGTNELSDVPVEILAGSRIGSPDRLAPGESGSAVVRYDIDDELPAGQPAALSLQWWETTDDSPVDWAARKDALRPDDVGPARWDAAWPVFLDLVGDEYGAYASRLGNKALQGVSQGRTDVSTLVELLVEDALGYVPMATGTVVDADGAPAPGRLVTARSFDGTVAESAYTAADGTFAVPGLEPGRYQLAVSGGPLAAPAIVEIVDGPVGGLLLQLAPAGSVSGVATVDGAPVDGWKVRLEHQGGRDVALVTTEADGSFAVPGLVPGAYVVRLLDADGHQVASAAAVVTALADTNVTLAAVGGVTVEGTVEAEGEPEAGVDVTVSQLDGAAVASVRTDQSGGYTTAGRVLPPGEYVVSARAEAGSARETVTASGGSVTRDLSLTLGEEVTGVVTDPDGEPLEGVLVRVDGVGSSKPLRTDEDGAYEVRAATGDRTLFFELEGYQPLESELTVDPGGETHDVELDPTNTLTVEVVNGDGQPLDGVPIDIVPADGALIGGLTGADGTLVLRGTSDAVHEVLVASPLSPGTVIARDEVDLTDDATVTFELDFGSVTGVVTRGGSPVEGARVAIVRDGGELAAHTTETDGVYEFTVLDGQPVDVVVVDNPDQVAARDVPVPLGETTTRDLELDDAVGVTVSVAAGGAPVDGAAATLVGRNGEALGSTAITDPSGDAHLAASPGDYLLTVESDAGAVEQREITVGASGHDEAVDLAAGGGFTGNVGVPGATVVGVHESGLRLRTVSDAAGHYELGDFPAGDVTLTVAAIDRPPSAPVTAAVVVGADTPVDPAPGADGSGRVVTGTVEDADGEPVAGATVTVLDANEQAVDRAVTDADGSFELVGGPDEVVLYAALADSDDQVTLPAGEDSIDLEVDQAPATANPLRVGADGPNRASSSAPRSGAGEAIATPSDHRSNVDAMFMDLSRMLDYRGFPPPTPLGPDTDPLFDTRWTDYAPLLEDCPEAGPLFSAAAAKSRHMQQSYRAWEAAADAASIETGADFGEVLAEGAIVGLETAKFLAELADLYKPQGLGQAFKNDVTKMGDGVVENAKLSRSLLKNTKLSESTIDNLDTDINFAISVMQDSMAKFQAGDWDGAMSMVNSIDISNLNALKYSLAMAEQAAGEGKLGKGLGGLGKAIEVIELIDKWQQFVKKQDAAFNDTGPASRYAAAQDNYAQAVQDYQTALAALAQTTAGCPKPAPEEPPEEPECPPGEESCVPPKPPKPAEPPKPPGPKCPTCKQGPKPTRPQRPTDPNEIVGPEGAGADNWRTELTDLPYLVLFENLPAAEASAIIVDITLPVDDDADLDSVQFTGMGWGGAGGAVATIDEGTDAIEDVIDIDGPAEVHVLAEVDEEARELHWRFEARDEETGELHVDGFLPPNDPATHVGEGWVDFRMDGADGLVTGDGIEAQATIVFDTEEAIATNVWVNRLDLTPPAATVDALPATVGTETFPVSWAGDDEGSGVATYDVYVSVDGGPFTLWLDDTEETSADHPGVDGVTYAFEAVATDAVGHEEAVTGSAEATTTVDAAPVECTTPFADVPPEHLFCDDVLWLYEEGITVGTTLPNGQVVFRPTVGLTRQEMAAFLYRYAGEPEVDGSTPFFADVPTSHPFFEEIQWMGESGNAVGTPDPEGGKPLYEPKKRLTRQEMAAFLWRLAGEPEVEPGTPAFFADVPASHLFFDAIQWMGDTGISVGTPNPSGKPSYGPRQVVTRQAMAAFLHRADPVLG